jgi:glycosyltransferase XagB
MELILLITSIIIIFQSLINIYIMAHAWDKDTNEENKKLNLTQDSPLNSFTILLPAYKEEKIIEETLKSIAQINYPKELLQVLVVLRHDDTPTIDKVNKTINNNQNICYNFKVIVVEDKNVSKPNQLNWGLKQATNNIITIVDAEDEVAPNVLKEINKIFHKEQLDVIQNACVLTNLDSKWFSNLNALEYYFWFKSALVFFAKNGIMPLGGNSVFIKRSVLNNFAYDETRLTEDADLGIRLSTENIKFKSIFIPEIATREETPSSVKSFIKQRTRWIQGFLQIYFSNQNIKKLSLRKLIYAQYILLWPCWQGLNTLYFLFLVYFIVSGTKVALPISMLTVYPGFLLLIQIIMWNFGLYQYIKEFRLKSKFFSFVSLFLFFIPYNFMLCFATIRAMLRFLFKQFDWEKTEHFNLHRPKNYIDSKQEITIHLHANKEKENYKKV